MLRAVIFDFDGVIVDSEPLIMALTQGMAEQQGWTLSVEEYYRDYLALDDRGIVEHLYRSHGQSAGSARSAELIHWKEEAYLQAMGNGLPPVPGAPEFVRRCAMNYPLAIASGSLRREVEYLLEKLDLLGAFGALSTADDCKLSKPHPCSYLTALNRLRGLDIFRRDSLKASECLAVEDAPAGVHAAHAAGMKCMALARSRPASELRHAEWVFENFAAVDLHKIAEEV